MLPKILVGGFSHTGTSLIVQFLHEMGFNVGFGKYMSRYDAEKRPYGHWAYVPMRKVVHGYVREQLGSKFSHACEPNYLPKRCLPFNKKIAKKVREIAERDDVEVYKDLTLPLTWPLFPKNAKYIFMSRSERVLFQHWDHLVRNYQQFHDAWSRYQNMGKEMANNVATLFVQYEDFKLDFPLIAIRIAEFVEYDGELDVVKLQRIYKVDKKTIDV